VYSFVQYALRGWSRGEMHCAGAGVDGVPRAGEAQPDSPESVRAAARDVRRRD